MITKINHIGIAVKSLDDTIPLYRDILGLKLEHIEEIEDQKVKVAMFSVGEVHIELLEPTSPDSNIAKYLEKKGPGIHHIAFQTDDIENNIQKIQDNNLQMIDKEPRCGANNTKIAFIHPKSTHSVLMELCQCTK
ncbi:MAG: methylmalonyl-CoA epimerase [Planctomycetes bacterium]|jgi:methylmalonyl-CoA/ethylmalonyl-CoA epimerase|nr:methylmalonyl-CoA epimerase [Planctomycetota bacterium]HNZ67539.1 methylmalonyl-CoA epimerase [Planctomycetota bacterium]HON44179.1 methylmalonyl-CoA epimerase [Planctomycetota bacterium]HPY75476.1 methylmalonyl-CoA epimerase [Planctomycetota bacterium]HQB01356.1 methylmalonyl-CoA epimerase [Planctomycetota bacterium]